MDTKESKIYQEFKELCTRPVHEIFDEHGFAAFSADQFEEGLRKLDLPKGVRVRRVGPGMFVDSRFVGDLYRAFDASTKAMHDKVATDREFARIAFLYEIENHEYLINYQGAWDVCNCFSGEELEWGESKGYRDYLKEAGYPDETADAFAEALRQHRKDAIENNWY